jgi:hypothetical protein
MTDAPQEEQQELARYHVNYGEAAAAAAVADIADTHLEHGKKFVTQHWGMRAILQAATSQCGTAKGEVLILAPCINEKSCAFGDEACRMVALFKAAGYRVTFKCDDAAACPEGPPAVEDYKGWSKYAFVAVFTVGDADSEGENPVILARAPTDFSDEDMADWQAGRMVLTGEGLFALR